ncbi:hypothetical protein M0R45_005714 [Rubus argutus]|uniref:Uncharacterized protein n=1 Tax=Rubus argutus TaxID=59490 RepID=A0AAW1YNJ5_RUBAR
MNPQRNPKKGYPKIPYMMNTNAGSFYEWVGAGVSSVKIKGFNNGTIDLSAHNWTYKIGPLTWYKAIVDPLPGRALYMHGCVQECNYRGKFDPDKCNTGCGEPTQRWYHVPRSWFKPSGNVLVIFEEKGGDPLKIEFSRRKIPGVCALAAEDYPSIDLESWHEENGSNKSISIVNLKCPENTHISTVKFASFGNPTGSFEVVCN